LAKGGKSSTSGETPTIHADQRAYKSKPQQPGGMEVPNQDKDVYNRFDPKSAQGGGQGTGQVERLLPSPEKPETPPAPVASAPVPPPSPPPALTSPGPLPLAQPASPQAPVPIAPVVEPPPPPVNVTGLPKVPEAPPKIPAAAMPPPPSAAAAKTAAPAAKPAVSAKTAAAPAKAVANGAYLVQLGALKEQSATAKEWARLQKEFSDLLGGLSLDVQEADLGAKGTFWRVRGGPLSDAESAKKICEELAKRKQGCMVVRK
jgi:hypothetical protein